jgi:hypothetical protein
VDIEGIINENFPNSIVSNYIIIAEIVSEDGINLQVISSESLTPWTALGMFEMAQERIVEWYSAE